MIFKRGEIMAKKKKTTKKQEVVEKGYTNPTNSWWGKAIVWIIIFGMVGLIILTLVIAILTGNA